MGGFGSPTLGGSSRSARAHIRPRAHIRRRCKARAGGTACLDAEAGVGGGEAHVAGGDQVHARAVAGAVHQRDGGAAHPLQARHRVLQRAERLAEGVRVARAAAPRRRKDAALQAAQVDAAAEIPARARQQDHARALPLQPLGRLGTAQGAEGCAWADGSPRRSSRRRGGRHDRRALVSCEQAGLQSDTLAKMCSAFHAQRKHEAGQTSKQWRAPCHWRHLPPACYSRPQHQTPLLPRQLAPRNHATPTANAAAVQPPGAVLP